MMIGGNGAINLKSNVVTTLSPKLFYFQFQDSANKFNLIQDGVTNSSVCNFCNNKNMHCTFILLLLYQKKLWMIDDGNFEGKLNLFYQ